MAMVGSRRWSSVCKAAVRVFDGDSGRFASILEFGIGKGPVGGTIADIDRVAVDEGVMKGDNDGVASSRKLNEAISRFVN